MAEYWKSTERYWCKHCACYVRDTKLERQNHEATAKHQGALKRFLRDLHRGHEREERDKERARQEIDRLNGVSSGSSSASKPAASASAAPSTSKPGAPSESDLKKQREQLAQMGVQMPDTFRSEMAMPGEWTVTNTRVIETKSEEEKTAAKATGVRKREVTEEDKEEEDAVRGLFKKPKKWGRDSKMAQHGDNDDLDALLSGTLPTVKSEGGAGDEVKTEEDAKARPKEEDEQVKDEPDDSTSGIKSEPATADHGLDASVKHEDDDAAGVQAAQEPPAGGVVFKKRKPKTIRQR